MSKDCYFRARGKFIRTCPNSGNPFDYQVEYWMRRHDDPNKDKDTKYAMRVIDCNNNSGKMAIVIGQNPSISSKYAIDKTNQMILKILRTMGYRGYIMINTFPTICTKNASPDKHLLSNIRVARKIIRRNINLEIILACSKKAVSVSFYYKILEKYKDRISVCYSANVAVTHFSQQNIYGRNLFGAGFQLAPLKTMYINKAINKKACTLVFY